MPLKIGGKWSYTLQGSFDKYVDTLEVKKKVPVGRSMGFQIEGGLGVSQFAWQGGELFASELGGQFFDPPLPLISKSGRWEGECRIAGSTHKATAQIENKMTEEILNGKSTEALQSTITLLVKGKQRTTTIWFVSGMGILRQEQRLGDHREYRLDYLSGP